MKKRDNATEWENQTNGCVRYKCDNDYGNITLNICNNDGGIKYKCTDDFKCVIDEPPVNKEWSVVIEFEEGEVSVAEMDITYFMNELSTKCGIEAKEIVIAVETDENGNIVRFIIYVNSENTANVIVNGVKEIDEGIFKKKKSVHVLYDNSVRFIEMDNSNVIDELSYMIVIACIVMIYEIISN